MPVAGSQFLIVACRQAIPKRDATRSSVVWIRTLLTRIDDCGAKEISTVTHASRTRSKTTSPLMNWISPWQRVAAATGGKPVICPLRARPHFYERASGQLARFRPPRVCTTLPCRWQPICRGVPDVVIDDARCRPHCALVLAAMLRISSKRAAAVLAKRMPGDLQLLRQTGTKTAGSPRQVSMYVGYRSRISRRWTQRMTVDHYVASADIWPGFLLNLIWGHIQLDWCHCQTGRFDPVTCWPTGDSSCLR